MKPPDRFSHNDPREWLNRARSNLARAKTRTDDAYWEDMCFDAQQAAEKAVKARLMGLGVEFPYVHDLARLLTLVQEAGETVPDAVLKAAELTPYATLTRYPGPVRAVSVEEYRTAVQIAEAVVRWAEKTV